MPSPMPSEEMDDLTARVGRLEVLAADTRADVAFIKATLPHLATKAELEELRSELKGGSGELRAELKGAYGELRAEFKDANADLRAFIGEVRAELKGDIGELRAELKADIGELRAELKADIGELRAELKGDIGRLDARIERVDGNIARMEAAMIRWAVGLTLACGSVAGSLAFTAAKLVH